jgi:RNA polymerase sigma factor (TIGR02999 family)
MEAQPQTISELLADARCGKREAIDRVAEILYKELRKIAAVVLRDERPSHTLQPTALVHEAYVRLLDHPVVWQNRAHFLAIAARAMRHVLVDHARRRDAEKRGGGLARVTFEGIEAADEPGYDVLALDEALRDLSAANSRLGRIVELRFLGGLTIDETAEVLGVATATVERDWVFARAWLRRQLGGNEP